MYLYNVNTCYKIISPGLQRPQNQFVLLEPTFLRSIAILLLPGTGLHTIMLRSLA